MVNHPAVKFGRSTQRDETRFDQDRPAADPPATQPTATAIRDACRAIRRGSIERAEGILISAADTGEGDAAWLNLRGALYEARGDWRRARRFYGKAMRADRRFAAAEQNMRRWFELFTFGRTNWPVALGDEMPNP